MKKRILAVCLLGLFNFLFAVGAGASSDDFVAAKSRLISILVSHGIGKAEAEKIFSDERIVLYLEILQKIAKKPSGKKFSYFSPEFGMFTPRSILRGREIMERKSEPFTEVERAYKVEKEALVAIFRIETNLGENLGQYRVFNSLLTLAAIKNRRSDWAEKELISFILLCRRNGLDPLEIKGSWAGAFGFCQFMPSSFMSFAVDGDGDGRIDLFSVGDAMASAANYLKKHGWQMGDSNRQLKAVYAYNHSDEYAKAVLAYAKAIKKK